MLSTWFQPPEAEGRAESCQRRVSQRCPGALPFPKSPWLCSRSSCPSHWVLNAQGWGNLAHLLIPPLPPNCLWLYLIILSSPKIRELIQSVSPAPTRLSHHQTHIYVFPSSTRNSFHTIRHFKMELHHLFKPHPAGGSHAVAATGAKKNRGCFSTPALTDLHQTILISTFHAMIRLPEEACQMPLIMDVILNYSLGMFFFLDMPLSSPTNFLSHPRIDPIKTQKAEVCYVKER